MLPSAVDQAPPAAELLKVVVAPSHTLGVPVFAATPAFTVSAFVAIAPQPVLYEISVVPAETAVIKPVVAFIVALDVLLLVQLP